MPAHMTAKPRKPIRRKPRVFPPLPFGCRWTEEELQAIVRGNPKPRKGTARAMQRARARLAKTRLAAACVLVRERDGGRCVVCFSPRDVQVHHITFRSQGGGHDPENLVCLCVECHGMVHDRKLWLSGTASDLQFSTQKP